MGGVKDALFGKPASQKSESGNHAWDAISGAMSPALGYTKQGGDAVSSLLGLGGGPAQTEALNNFANSGGMNFLREQGNKQITSNKAASGLLKSGSFGTALTKFGQGLGSTYLNQYMGQAMDLAKLGLGAGGVMAGAGSWSKGSNKGAKKGLLQMAGEAAEAYASGGAGGGG